MRICVIIALMVALMLGGCAPAPQPTPPPQKVQKVEVPQKAPEVKKPAPKGYYLLVRLKESHFTLDIGTHIKDAANSVTFVLPTSKEFYDSLKVGDNILRSEGFRTGSLFINGSISDYEIVVKDKAERIEDLKR